MFAMLKQLFAALTVLFGATEKFANAFNEIAIWSEEEAQAFNRKSRLQRDIIFTELDVKSRAQLAKEVRLINREAQADQLLDLPEPLTVTETVKAA